MNLPNQGNGADQFKAQVIQWIRQELAKAAQGGIGLHLDGATGNLIIDNGDVRSGNYVAGSAGWDLAPSGSAELGQTTVRGGKIQSGNYVAGTSGWGLDGAGNAEFNSLTLRGGIIGNAALTNPVSASQFMANTVTNFASTTSFATVTSIAVPVPSGFSTAVVTTTGFFRLNNSSAASTFQWGRCVIAGTPDQYTTVITNPGQLLDGRSVATGYVSSLTTGSTVLVEMQVSSGVAFSANTQNLATLTGVVIWLR